MLIKYALLVIQFIIIVIVVINLNDCRTYIESEGFEVESKKLLSSFMVNIVSYDNPIKFFVSPFLNL